jgi:hypothetical protein
VIEATGILPAFFLAGRLLAALRSCPDTAPTYDAQEFGALLLIAMASR